MADEKNENEKITWQVPEYDRPKRNRNWYIATIVVIIAITVYSIISANYLFTIIMIIGSIMLFWHDYQEAPLINIELEEEGIVIGSKFYDYDEIKSFSIVYKPKENIKNLYLIFNNNFKNRLTIHLMDKDPLKVRRYLLQYVDENLDRVNEPMSESIAKFLKLQ